MSILHSLHRYILLNTHPSFLLQKELTFLLHLKRNRPFSPFILLNNSITLLDYFSWSITIGFVLLSYWFGGLNRHSLESKTLINNFSFSTIENLAGADWNLFLSRLCWLIHRRLRSNSFLSYDFDAVLIFNVFSPDFWSLGPLPNRNLPILTCPYSCWPLPNPALAINLKLFYFLHL